MSSWCSATPVWPRSIYCRVDSPVQDVYIVPVVASSNLFICGVVRRVARAALAVSVAVVMASTVITFHMEDLLCAVPTLPSWVYVGGCCCLAHGVLLRQDLQRSFNLRLIADALVGVSWTLIGFHRGLRHLRKLASEVLLSLWWVLNTLA